MKIHILMHESFESPGSIIDWAFENDHTATYTCFYMNEELPSDVSGFDMLVVLGGPQSPDTTQQECEYFNAAAEIAFIKKAIDAGKHVLGICLGAQLIGEALGAPYEKSPETEIGAYPVFLTDEGQEHPFFAEQDEAFFVGHWHNDMPGLTADAKVLATSKGCPRQIIEYTPKVYGFQCHMEFTEEDIEDLIDHHEAELAAMADKAFVQDVDMLRKNNFDDMNEILSDFLDYFVAQ